MRVIEKSCSLCLQTQEHRAFGGGGWGVWGLYKALSGRARLKTSQVLRMQGWRGQLVLSNKSIFTAEGGNINTNTHPQASQKMA